MLEIVVVHYRKCVYAIYDVHIIFLIDLDGRGSQGRKQAIFDYRKEEIDRRKGRKECVADFPLVTQCANNICFIVSP